MAAMDPAHFASRLSEDARTANIALTDEQAVALVDYLGLLSKWNGVYNLTAIRDPEQMRVQHVLDSLAILPFLDARNVRSVIDVGTGGGLPGMVIAIMRPTWRVVLNDIVQKKTAFLTQAKGSLGLHNVAVHTGRVEDIADADGFDAVVSRAFADLADFARLARHLVRSDGAMYAMKGLRPDDEIARLPEGASVEEVITLKVPHLDASRHLLVVKFQQAG